MAENLIQPDLLVLARVVKVILISQRAMCESRRFPKEYRENNTLEDYVGKI